MIKIGFDLDGTVVDFISTFIKYVKDTFNCNVKTEDLQDYSDILKILLECTHSPKDVNDIIDKLIYGYNNLYPYPGAVEFINSLKIQPVFITARDSYLIKPTTKWLDKYLDISYHLYFMFTKSEACLKENLDIFVEDHFIIANEIAEKGIDVFLIDRPWNQNCVLNDRVVRVFSWQEVADKYMERCNANTKTD